MNEGIPSLHDHKRRGGRNAPPLFGREQQADEFDCLDAPIIRVTAPDIPAIPAAPPLEEFYMPNVEKIVTALERSLQY